MLVIINMSRKWSLDTQVLFKINLQPNQRFMLSFSIGLLSVCCGRDRHLYPLLIFAKLTVGQNKCSSMVIVTPQKAIISILWEVCPHTLSSDSPFFCSLTNFNPLVEFHEKHSCNILHFLRSSSFITIFLEISSSYH